MFTQRFCKKIIYWKVRECDLTVFIGKVHCITDQMNGIQNQKWVCMEYDLYRE